LSASGGVPPYTWSVSSGNLPPGLVLSPAGSLSGTPTSAGAFSFTAQVTDLAHPQEVGNVVVSLTVIDPLLIQVNSLPNGSPGVFYNASVAFTGGIAEVSFADSVAVTGGIAPYSWRVTQGNLPAGLSLNATTGALSGVVTDIGLSSFTVQVSDSQNPAATSSERLSISVNTAPPRNAVLYLGNWIDIEFIEGSHELISSDGSLTQLSALSDPATPTVISPKLPIAFATSNSSLISMLVNPDYSVTPISSVALPSVPDYHRASCCYTLTVDPTGSNLYLSGVIDNQDTQGISVYPANGLLDLVSTIAIPGLWNPSSTVKPAFTPDGARVYIALCRPFVNGSNIQTYSRNSDGTLTQTSSYALPPVTCASHLAVSPDGKYLADVEEDLSGVPPVLHIQVYRVASDGTITPALNQPLPLSMLGFPWPGTVRDMIWDESSSYLLPMIGAPSSAGTGLDVGGIAALNFSGTTLTETSPPIGGGGFLVQRTGSFVYGNITCTHHTPFVPPDPCLTPLGPNGFNISNGQLQPVPGSPFPYSFSAPTAIY
jgi:hypothetical protein